VCRQQGTCLEEGGFGLSNWHKYPPRCLGWVGWCDARLRVSPVTNPAGAWAHRACTTFSESRYVRAEIPAPQTKLPLTSLLPLHPPTIVRPTHRSSCTSDRSSPCKAWRTGNIFPRADHACTSLARADSTSRCWRSKGTAVNWSGRTRRDDCRRRPRSSPRL